VNRVINTGGIPHRNQALNRIYANILDKTILVPESDTTSLGSAIFAFLAAGAFQSIEEAQDELCPAYREFNPDPDQSKTADRIYDLYRSTYFKLGQDPMLPTLRSSKAKD